MLIPSQQTSVTFGETSQWAQPWRAYLTTVPASTFLDGTSLNFNYGQGANPDLVMEQLAKHGIHRIRIEVGWGAIDYTTGQLDNTTALAATMAACATWNIRPLILLNANSQVPVPEQTFSATTASTAAAGSTTLTLTSTSGIVVGYTGVSDLDDNNIAAQEIVTAVNGNTVTLSQPLPSAVSAGASLPMATLKCRPFSTPGSADYNATLAGWLSYVSTVANFARTALGTTGAANGGFDLEVWNELTFGSQFLDIDNYYSPAVYGGDPGAIQSGILAATASLAANNPSLFSGVHVGDGFANTLPWPASSTEPAGVDAIDKHVYPGPVTYDGSPAPGGAVDALGQPDAGGWSPDYTAYFPESNDTALQTEYLGRDMGPLKDDVYGTEHGATAGGGDMPVWITETNLMPNLDDSGMDAATDEYLKTKVALRDFCFYLNKGATDVDLYDATSGELNFGELSDAFVQLADTPGATYPADDASVTSPEMQAVGNVAQLFSQGLNPTLTTATTRSVMLNSVTDASDATQFTGDGTAAHPSLYDADLFTFLPYQVNATTFTIPYYVMTRDITQVQQPGLTGGHQYDLPTEPFSLSLSGVHGNVATVTAYDPIDNDYLPVAITGRSSDTLNVTVPATDYPYILTIHDQTPAATVGSTPTFTSGTSATWPVGEQSAFSVITTGSPAATLTEQGTLPAGVSFVANADGTATLSGVPTAAGTYPFTFTASSGAGTMTQGFTLTVAPAAAEPGMAVSFGGVAITSGEAPSARNGTQFGEAMIGSGGADETFTILNTGSAPLDLTNLTVSGSDFTVVQPAPATLAAGASGMFELQMGTDTAGQQAGTVTIDTNLSDAPTFTFSLAGIVSTEAQPVLDLSLGSGAAVAALPNSISFGTSVQSDAGATHTFTVRNTGDGLLTIEAVVVPVGFVLTAAPPTELAPGGVATFTVSMITTAAGAFAGTLSVGGNGGQSSIALSGSVIPEVGSAAAATTPLMIEQLAMARHPAKPLVGGTRAATVPIRVVLQNGAKPGAAAWSGVANVVLLAMPDAQAAAAGDATLTLGQSSVRLHLKAGQSHALNLRAAFPTIITDGNFELVAHVSGAGLPTGGIMVGNPAAVLLLAAHNQLRVTEPSQIRTAKPGASVALPIEIQNIGDVAADGAVTGSVVLSPDAADGDATSITLSPVTHPLALAAGSERRVTLAVHLPTDLPAGRYVLEVTLSDAGTTVQNPLAGTLTLNVA